MSLGLTMCWEHSSSGLEFISEPSCVRLRCERCMLAADPNRLESGFWPSWCINVHLLSHFMALCFKSQMPMFWEIQHQAPAHFGKQRGRLRSASWPRCCLLRPKPEQSSLPATTALQIIRSKPRGKSTQRDIYSSIYV